MESVDPEVRGILDQMARDIYEKSSRPGPLELRSRRDLDDTIARGTAVVVFYNPTCPVCKRYLPVYEDFVKKKGQEYKGVRFAKINTREAEGVSSEHMIFAVPTTVVFREGKEVKRVEGYMGEKELDDFMKSLPIL